MNLANFRRKFYKIAILLLFSSIFIFIYSSISVNASNYNSYYDETEEKVYFSGSIEEVTSEEI